MLILRKGEHLGIYHVGTMEEITIEEVALEIVKYFKRDVHIVPGPLMPGGTKRRCPDITKLKKLGYAPKISFKEGLKLTAQWYDQNVFEKTVHRGV